MTLPKRPVSKTDALDELVRRHLARARVTVAWERLWPELWPLAGTVGIFLALAGFDVLPRLPGWLHAAIVAGLAAAFLAFAMRAVRRFKTPGEDEARSRLEHDSGLSHRPLAVLQDQLTGTPDAATAALWAIHRERMRRQIQSLRLKLPRPGLAVRDQWALRALIVLAMLVAGIVARDDWDDRILAAVSPQFTLWTPTPPPQLDLWITPPAYTRQPPLFLKPEMQATVLPVPTGSVLVGRVTGSDEAPQLNLNDQTTPFQSADAQSWQVQGAVTAGERLTVEQDGDTLGEWSIAITPDQPPEISFDDAPEGSERGAVRLSYTASDDYGITQAQVTMRRPEGEGAVTLPLSAPRMREDGQAKATTYQDLTAHPWAGLPVTIQLAATDAAGQTGQSLPLTMVLPERTFHHPVARAIIDARKTLTRNPDIAREEVAGKLDILSLRPDRFHEDIVAFLALRTGAARLLFDQDGSSVAPVQKLLWDTALRIEDGGLSLARRDLRDAQQALADALDRNAPDEEIQHLMSELQQAMDRFLDALTQQALQQMQQVAQPIPVPPGQDMLSREDLQRMMDQMRAMAETGSRDAARQMLSQLQDLLENLQTGGSQQDMGQAGQMLNDLERMAREQQQLLDESFRQQQKDMEGAITPMGPQAGQGKSPADRQEDLRRQLGELTKRMEENGMPTPKGLGRAERAMRKAEQALGMGVPGEAVPSQSEAVDQLQQGMRDFANRLGQQMMGMQPGQRTPGQRMGNRGRDPLGRPSAGQGMLDSGDVKVPEQSEVQKAREILDELRRRSGELERPRLELEYIDRLLQRF